MTIAKNQRRATSKKTLASRRRGRADAIRVCKEGDGRNAMFLTLYARGTYEDPDSHKRNEEKDARIAEVESASIGGRALRLTDTAEDFRKLRELLKSTSRA